MDQKQTQTYPLTIAQGYLGDSTNMAGHASFASRQGLYSPAQFSKYQSNQSPDLSLSSAGLEAILAYLRKHGHSSTSSTTICPPTPSPSPHSPYVSPPSDLLRSLIPPNNQYDPHSPYGIHAITNQKIPTVYQTQDPVEHVTAPGSNVPHSACSKDEAFDPFAFVDFPPDLPASSDPGSSDPYDENGNALPSHGLQSFIHSSCDPVNLPGLDPDQNPNNIIENELSSPNPPFNTVISDLMNYELDYDDITTDFRYTKASSHLARFLEAPAYRRAGMRPEANRACRQARSHESRLTTLSLRRKSLRSKLKAARVSELGAAAAEMEEQFIGETSMREVMEFVPGMRSPVVRIGKMIGARVEKVKKTRATEAKKERKEAKEIRYLAKGRLVIY